jgi:hypothetical protein
LHYISVESGRSIDPDRPFTLQSTALASEINPYSPQTASSEDRQLDKLVFFNVSLRPTTVPVGPFELVEEGMNLSVPAKKPQGGNTGI